MSNSYHLSTPALLSSSVHTTNFSLIPTTSPSTSFNLGMNLELPRSSVALPSISTSTPLSLPASISTVTPKIPDLHFLSETATTFFKSDIPKPLKIGETIISAATAGKTLADRIQNAQNAGETPAKSYTCQTIRTLTEEVTGAVMKDAIISGIPPYLVAAATSLPLVMTVPVVLPLIPMAYSGANAAAEALGNAADAGCHSAFDVAKKLSSGGLKP